MTVFLAVLGAVAGGAIGAILGFFTVIALGALTGSSNDQGGLAMGAALVGAPAGLFIGAVAGTLLVLRLRRVPADGPEPGTTGGTINRRNAGIALIIVLGVLFGLWRIFLHVPPPPLLKGARPVLFVELRLPADAMPTERQGDLRTLVETYGGDNLYPDGPLTRRVDGDHLILSARHTLRYRYGERRLTFYVSPDRMLIANLNLADIPPATKGFTDWRPVDHLREHYYGEDLPGAGDFTLRTRVAAGG